MIDRSQKRHGAVIPLTGILMIPLAGMLAFAIDTGHMWRCDAELQNAADSAALAGCARLVDGNFRMSAQPALLPTQVIALRYEAETNARAEAKKFGEFHSGGMTQLVLNTADIEVGYIQNPAAKPNTPEGAFQTGPATPFPNSVRVKTRRDATVSSGPLPLFFGRIFNVPTSDRNASATASLRSANIVGFAGQNSGILPIVMHIDVYDYLVGNTNIAPEGLVDQDNFKVDMPIESGLAPPTNVTSGQSDGRREGNVYFKTEKPSGNWGLIDLRHNVNGAPGNPNIARWIREGPSAEELAGWPGGFKAGDGATNPDGSTNLPPLQIDPQPGLQASNQNDLESIKGQPRVMPVYKMTSGGGGQTAVYEVVGFIGVVIVDVNLTGSPAQKRITVQTIGVLTPEPIFGGSSQSSTATYVYKGLTLSR